MHSKGNHQSGRPVVATAKKQQSKTKPEQFDASSGITVAIIFVLYCLIDFVPGLKANDDMSTEWFYLAVLNALVALYIIYKRKAFLPAIGQVVKAWLSRAYLVFFLIAGLSILFAMNKTEAWACYIRIITTIIAFFNLSVLLKNNQKLFIYLAGFVAILALAQSIQALSTFYKTVEKATDITSLILGLKGNTSNKNILAASLAIKIPFVFYCIYSFKNWSKYCFTLLLGVVLTTVAILNARSAFISVILEIICFTIIYLFWYFKNKNLKTLSINLACVFVPAVLAVLISSSIFANLNRRAAVQNLAKYGSVAGRLGSSFGDDASANLSLTLWQHAIQHIKANPLMGAGVGNWKIADGLYDRDTSTDFIFAKHAHNDFLEITAELGIFGGLAFVAILLLVFYNIIATLRSDSPESQKAIALVSFLMLVAYTVDAALNFPLERPTMQVYFAFMLAINLFGKNMISEATPDNASASKFSLAFAVPIVLSVVVIYYSKLFLESSRHQFTHNTELFVKNAKEPDSFYENEGYGNFPNITDNNYPVDVLRAYNAYHVNNTDEAIRLLNKSTKINPYSMSNEYVKSLVYNKLNKMDSALYYAKKGMYARPKSLYFYESLSDICLKLKDIETLKKATIYTIPYNNDTRMIDRYVNMLFIMNSDRKNYDAVLDVAEKQWPKNEDIRYKRNYVYAKLASAKGDAKGMLANLLKLAKKYPKQYNFKQDIGGVYYALKDYKKANFYLDDVLAHNGSVNGKAEFFKGNLLLMENKKEEACQLLKIAADQNFPDAKRLYDANNCMATARTPAPGLPAKLPFN